MARTERKERVPRFGHTLQQREEPAADRGVEPSAARTRCGHRTREWSTHACRVIADLDGRIRSSAGSTDCYDRSGSRGFSTAMVVRATELVAASDEHVLAIGSQCH